MYRLSCKALGVDDCGYQAEGPTQEDVVRTMRQHGEKAHPEDAAHTSTEKMEDAVEQA